MAKTNPYNTTKNAKQNTATAAATSATASHKDAVIPPPNNDAANSKTATTAATSATASHKDAVVRSPNNDAANSKHKLKPQLAPPKVSSNNVTRVNGKQFTVTKAKTNLIVGFVLKNNNAPFMLHTHDYMAKHFDDFTYKTLKIHYIGNRRHPEDPFDYDIKCSMSGFSKTKPVYVQIVPDDQAHKNTPAARKAWALTYIKFHNDKRLQAKYRFAEDIHWTGDITPQDEDRAPFLSDFLTIPDTMEVIRRAHFDETINDRANIADIVRDSNILAKYYAPDLLPKVHEHFAPYLEESPDHQAGNDDDDDIAGGIQPFQL